MRAPQLLPYPRHLRLTGRTCHLPGRIHLQQDGALAIVPLRQIAVRLSTAIEDAASVVAEVSGNNLGDKPLIHLRRRAAHRASPTTDEGYELTIDQTGVRVTYGAVAGALASVATLCQLLRQYGRRLPCLRIRDWPDFQRRGVLLDVSRGRVPNLRTLKQLARDLAGFKINELQLYFEHTFAYRNQPQVWRGWGALTASEIRSLDEHCHTLGIDLVPNQNSFGHLRHLLQHPKSKSLAEVQEPYSSADGTFLRYPSTLAPNHRGTLPLLRSLYDELLPNFSSRLFNVGCDETWDLGRGQSKALCQRKGQGRVYLEFLQEIQREVRRRGKTMQFWGDIILNHPHLIDELPTNLIALNWGYEADHPFQRECGVFANANIPFYVCPGTSSWQTMIGRNDNAFANLLKAARAGKRNGARGYLITDWGDGGHAQPLAVSYPAFLVGAAMAWCTQSYDERLLASVLNREVFQDTQAVAAQAALRLGFAHQKFGYVEPNATPFGATLAAPPSDERELFCRNGLKYYACLLPRNIRSAQSAVAQQRVRLGKSKPATSSGRLLINELDLAARMAAESCNYLLWQQALSDGRLANARSLATVNTRSLKSLKLDFEAYWPLRNKATPSKCAAFLDWRIEDYTEQRLHYTPAEALLSVRPN